MVTRKAVLLTALPTEYRAIRRHLSGVSETVHRGTVYEIGSFVGDKNTDWQVCLAEIGVGNPGAAAEAERAIAYFAPEVMLLVGVAGGIKDVQIGDVVVGTKIYGYESGKAARAFQIRPTVFNSSYDLNNVRVQRPNEKIGSRGSINPRLRLLEPSSRLSQQARKSSHRDNPLFFPLSANTLEMHWPSKWKGSAFSKPPTRISKFGQWWSAVSPI